MFVSPRSRPYRPLQQRAALAFLLTLLGTASFAGFLVISETVSPLAILRSISVPLALAGLAGPYLASHPHPVLGPANQLTLVRAGLVGGLAAFMFEADHASSIALTAVACLAFGLDGIDGWLARRTGTASPFGAQLDMELDGLFVVVLCGLAITMTGAGPWVWAAGLARYVFVGAAAIWPFMSRPLPPTRRRPWACGLGVGLLIGGLAPVPSWLALGCVFLGVATLVGSFAIDAWWLVRHREDGPW
ncbi:MAG: CDP-alcohol phosphatidyltransferase family protein [Myxococcota bacterium]